MGNEVGVGEAMGTYRALERLGQVFGPLALGAAITMAGIERGIALVGALFIVFTFFFVIGAKTEKAAPDSSSI